MSNTFVSNDGLEIRIGLFIQIPLPNVFDEFQTEDEIDSFSSAFAALLRKDYNVEHIQTIKAANYIKGDSTVACLMGLDWIGRETDFKLYELNLLWFQEGHAFPINTDVEKEIRNLRYDLVGRQELPPF